MKRAVELMTCLLLTSFTLSAQYHADIRGSDDDSDGGLLQLATPSESHFLRLYSGRTFDPKPYLYFSDRDTFRIASGREDFSNFQQLLTIMPNGHVGINTSNPQSIFHAHGDITTPWGLEFYHYEPSWVHSRQPYLAKSWTPQLWDFLYLGSTGNRTNQEQPALILSHRKGVLFGKGHDNASELSATHLQIDTSGNVGIQTTEPSAALEVNGYTMLGSDAPKIKLKKLMGTMPAAGASVSIAHGLASRLKITGVHILVDTDLGQSAPPAIVASDAFYNYTVTDTNIDVANLTTPPSDIIVGKPIRIVVMYEE